MKKALTIAGSDPNGGAGIQADLKTFTDFNIYGLSVITAVTAQNSLGVKSVFPLSPKIVCAQIDTLCSDLKPDGVKLGMLGNEKIISVIREKILSYKLPHLIIDPILKAKNGYPLLNKAGEKSLVKKLFPLAYLITPNIPEAEAILNISIRTLSDMEKAALELAQTGAKNILLKGGHFKGAAIDILYDGKDLIRFPGKRIKGKPVHGTGCILSAAITAGLINKFPLIESIRQAKEYTGEKIDQSLLLGEGNKFAVHNVLTEAFLDLQKAEIGHLIPEVQSNLVYARPEAKNISEIMGFPGRIIKKNKEIFTMFPPRLGGSSHMGRVLLAAMKYDPDKRVAMNIKYTPEIIAAGKKLNLKLAEFDRSDEPKEIKEAEGSSLTWGVKRAIEKYGSVPDLIYDTGDFGKEAMVRVFAATPKELTGMIKKIARMIK